MSNVNMNWKLVTEKSGYRRWTITLPTTSRQIIVVEWHGSGGGIGGGLSHYENRAVGDSLGRKPVFVTTVAGHGEFGTPEAAMSFVERTILKEAEEIISLLGGK